MALISRVGRSSPATPAAIDKSTDATASCRRVGATGGVDHTFLTSLIDQDGNLRVQYLGVRFDPDEFRRDLLGLLGETH